MNISNPIKGYKNKKYPNGQVTQWFGENVALYLTVKDDKGVSILTKGHNGIDIAVPYGSPVYAVEGGLVCEVKNSPAGYGKHCRILSPSGFEYTYGHASENLVNVGDEIKAGHMIQKAGNTGFVVSDINALGFWVKGSNQNAGTHIHFGMREFKYDKKGWSYHTGIIPKITILNTNNGYQGSIDPRGMFNPDSMMGDMEILKRELEKFGDEPWYMRMIRGLKFFGVK